MNIVEFRLSCIGATVWTRAIPGLQATLSYSTLTASLHLTMSRRHNSSTSEGGIPKARPPPSVPRPSARYLTNQPSSPCYFSPILRLTCCTAFSSSRRQTRSCSCTGSERLPRFPQLMYSPAEISHRSTRGLFPTWIRQLVMSMARHIAWPLSGKRSRKVGSCSLGGETTVGCWMCP